MKIFGLNSHMVYLTENRLNGWEIRSITSVMAVNLVRTSTRGVRSLNQAHFNAPWPFVKKGIYGILQINEWMSTVQEHTVKGRSDLSELKRINGLDRIDSSLNWVPSGIKRIQRYFTSERYDFIALLIYKLYHRITISVIRVFVLKDI